MEFVTYATSAKKSILFGVLGIKYWSELLTERLVEFYPRVEANGVISLCNNKIYWN